MPSEAPTECDVLIAGGGLAGGLIALALAEKRPGLDVCIVDPSPSLGGNHIWSFFDPDIAPQDRWLVEPLICHRWDDYEIAFPAHRRKLDTAYNSIESERLDELVRAAVPADRIIADGVAAISETGVTLASGPTISARHVIDARGAGDLSKIGSGWQKFVGMEIKVPGGHGLTRPIVMDATVDQIDGYRFVYCLPFDAETVFIEDTYYSDSPDLDIPAVRERIIAYAAERGWRTNGGGREENGVLPVVIDGDFKAYWKSSGEGMGKAGARAGLFHATTGYSLPDAVRLAAAMPALVDGSPQAMAASLRKRAFGHWRGQGFYRMLDAMLFRGADPHERYKVLERFYTLNPALIRRFYSGQSTLFDKLRILSGKPPIPIGRAVKAIMGRTK